MTVRLWRASVIASGLRRYAVDAGTAGCFEPVGVGHDTNPAALGWLPSMAMLTGDRANMSLLTVRVASAARSTSRFKMRRMSLSCVQLRVGIVSKHQSL